MPTLRVAGATTHPTDERYPLADLEQLVDADSTLTLARRLGVHVRQLYRWRHRGLTAERADVLAVRIGLHPALVWPTWVDDNHQEDQP